MAETNLIWVERFSLNSVRFVIQYCTFLRSNVISKFALDILQYIMNNIVKYICAAIGINMCVV